MTGNNHRYVGWIVLALTLGAAVFMIVATSPGSPVTGDPEATVTLELLTMAPSTLVPPAPLVTAADAISATLGVFPDGYTISNTVARRLTYATANTWRDASSPENNPAAPVWIVAVVAANLKPLDVLPLLPTEAASSLPATVPGAFYVWDANSGLLSGRGALDSVRTFASLSALSNEQVVISQATFPVPLPTLVVPATATDMGDQ